MSIIMNKLIINFNLASCSGLQLKADDAMQGKK